VIKMLRDEGIRRDDLVNQIHAAGSRFNKSLPVAALEVEAQKLKGFCEELLLLLLGVR
jgi:hypothetical protein